MKNSRYFIRTAAVLLCGALAACGGGGGGGGGGGSGGAPAPSARLQYSGNSNPAVITTSNASRLSAFVIADSGDDIVASSLSGGRPVQAAQDPGGIGPRLARIVRKTVKPLAATSRASSAPVDQTEACSGGGTVRFHGDIGPLGTGTLTVVYTNCVENGNATTGQATMSVEGTDPHNAIYTFYTLSFDRLSIRGSSNLDMTGSFQVVTTLITNTERTTENIVGFFVGSGRMIKSENVTFVDVYDDVRNPTTFTETISGRLYHSVHGYVDISTVTPLAFSTMTQVWPGSGEVLMTGAANARIRATAASESLAVLALDVNGDGTFETRARVNWNDLIRPPGSDLADTDGDGMHNSWEIAFGLNPNVNDAGGDLDNDGFSNLAEYHAGNLPNAHDTVLPPVAVAGRAIALAKVSDLVYDSATQRIYAAVRTNPGSVVPINPVTGALGTPITVGSLPAKLALSHNGQFLYVGLEGEASVQRINMATQSVDLTIALGGDALGSFAMNDIHVLPGAAQSIAVSLSQLGIPGNHRGIAIFDGSTPRPNVTPANPASHVIEFSASADTLYGYDNRTTGASFQRMAVTPSGVTLIDSYHSSQPGGALINGRDMKFGGGFLFTDSGQMIDPVARVQLPHPTGAPGSTFLPIGVFGLPAPDAALGRVIYLLGDHTFRIWTFDMNTRLQTGSAKVNGMSSGVTGSLIRWGANGLAFRTSEGQVASEGQVVILELPDLIPQ